MAALVDSDSSEAAVREPLRCRAPSVPGLAAAMQQERRTGAATIDVTFDVVPFNAREADAARLDRHSTSQTWLGSRAFRRRAAVSILINGSIKLIQPSMDAHTGRVLLINPTPASPES
ncbi:hypothetical protein [Bradyrhizobium sp. NAS80.1]|uniref:hypothetical protein n=1 Tax=Bradyrhizobium sp. NAS80.1 TaxID=1680159 RepID=UPI001FDA8EF6|nr:hypothetical protein [Bradyrhizobium sp. NAS80.1]